MVRLVWSMASRWKREEGNLTGVRIPHHPRWQGMVPGENPWTPLVNNFSAVFAVGHETPCRHLDREPAGVAGSASKADGTERSGGRDFRDPLVLPCVA